MTTEAILSRLSCECDVCPPQGLKGEVVNAQKGIHEVIPSLIEFYKVIARSIPLYEAETW